MLLSNSILLCGTDGSLTNGCVVANGTVQVQSLASVSIRGISFHSSSLQHTGDGTLGVQDCVFTGSFGGPVVAAVGTTQTTLTDCSFETMDYNIASFGASNDTMTAGALILASDGVLELERVKIMGTVNSSVESTLDLIRAENAVVTITNCEFSSSSAGSLLVGKGASTIVMSGTTFEGNNFANGLSFEGTVDVTIDDFVVTGNNFSTVRHRSIASYPD